MKQTFWQRVRTWRAQHFPVHYRSIDGSGGSWWSWRGKHYRYRPGKHG